MTLAYVQLTKRKTNQDRSKQTTTKKVEIKVNETLFLVYLTNYPNGKDNTNEMWVSEVCHIKTYNKMT